MILANRSVILCKINEFCKAINDLNSAIQTGKYPDENLYKLYQRLSKAHEQLEEFETAITNYKNVIEFVERSTLTKSQKLQVKNEVGKCMDVCKKRIMANSLTPFQYKDNKGAPSDFPTYNATHPEIINASGLVYIL